MIRAHFLTACIAIALFGCGAGDDKARAAAAEDTADQSNAASAEGAPGGTDIPPAGRPGGVRFGGQTGGEAGIRCNADVQIAPLAFDAPSPLGYSAADILAGLRASYSSPFSYDDASESELLITLASDRGGAGYAPGCSRNAIDVVVGWSTADGAFNETLAGTLFALSPQNATLHFDLPAENLLGSYASTHAAEIGTGPISFSFDLEFDPTTVHGSVSVLRGGPDVRDSIAIASF